MHGVVSILKGKLAIQRLQAEQGRPSLESVPMFGELALLDRRPRVNAAHADTDCKLLVLSVESFSALTMLVPDFKSRIRKLRESSFRVKRGGAAVDRGGVGGHVIARRGVGL